MLANSITVQLISNGRFPGAYKDSTNKIMNEVKNLHTASGADFDFSSDFITEEMDEAIKCLKPNNALGIDYIHPEFILYQG